MDRTTFILVMILLAGCDIVPTRMAVDDPRLTPMWEAARSFDRQAYGFSPLPVTGDVRLERRPRAGYDSMIHIYEKTSRTIAFRKTPNEYHWIHEQESFQGPRQYTSVDGTFHEQIVLTYETERIAGTKTNVLSISYWGEDTRFANRNDLGLHEVKPVLEEWGY